MSCSLRLAIVSLAAGFICLAAPATAKAQSYTNGLVARWTFDDDTGKDSVGANDAVLTGSPSMVTSPMGKAMEVRATAYAVANSPGLNVNGWTGITVSVWVKPVRWAGSTSGGAPGFTTYGSIICRGTDSSGAAFAMAAQAANKEDSVFNLSFSASESTYASFPSFTPSRNPFPVIGNWYHLVGTYDGHAVYTYVNGVIDGSKCVPVPGRALWEPTGSKTYIGTQCAMPFRAWGDIFFSGDFEEVSIWKRALTPNEIKQLYLANTQQVSFVAADAQPLPAPISAAHRIPAAVVPISPPTPPVEQHAAPPRDSTPKLISYSYDSKNAKGVLSVDIASGGMEARDWVIKNIGRIASSKEMMLEAGNEPTSGGRYKVLNESLKDGILTVAFEVLH